MKNIEETFLLYILALFIPPFAVFLKGTKKQLFLDIIFCCLFWIPGILYALVIVKNLKRLETYKSADNQIDTPEFTSEDKEEKTYTSIDNQIDIPKFISKKFYIAGTSFKQKEIKSLGLLNDDYTMSKKDIIDLGMTDEKIYQYKFNVSDIKLVEETEKDDYPGALRVLADNTMIGYIKKVNLSEVKSLLKNKNIPTKLNIYGGKYKSLVDVTDTEKELDALLNDKEISEVYEMEKEEIDFFAEIIFDIEIKERKK